MAIWPNTHSVSSHTATNQIAYCTHAENPYEMRRNNAQCEVEQSSHELHSGCDYSRKFSK